MYKNIFYERKKNLIHLWDDRAGYTTHPFRKYAYVRDNDGDYISIHGDKLRKITDIDNHNKKDLFESDVNEMTRFLIDTYGNSDDVSSGHTILTFDIEVEMNTGLPDTLKAENTITSIAFNDNISGDYYAYVLSDVRVDKIVKGAYVKSFQDERDMLTAFINKWQEINPSIVTGWNIDYFDITYLYNRICNVLSRKTANKLSPIGIVQWNKHRERYFIAGVSCLDYLALFKNYTYKEYPNYRLDSIAKLEIGRGKIEYDGNLDQLFRDDLEKFIEYNLVDVELVVELDKKLQFIDLAMAICHAGHVPYEDFVFSSKWLEGAILTFLKRNGRVAPNKPPKPKGEYSDIGFEGAYVKVPIPGKYKWFYDLDLTSLYPSIIMSLNISPETKVAVLKSFDMEAHMKGELNEYILIDTDGNQYDSMNRVTFTDFITKMNYSISSNGVLYRRDKQGVIPEVLNVWFDKRVEYKDLMKQYGKAGNDELYKFYSQRQLVQKIMLNSLYGVLGLSGWRFYDIDNALAVTSVGQTVIKTSQKIANKFYYESIGVEKDYCIYVDTDSLYLETIPYIQHKYPHIDINSDEQLVPVVLQLATDTQIYINKMYNVMAKRLFNIDTHRFDIKQETIAKSGLWVAKKRYAQWIINDNTVTCDKLDVKGLDIKRSSFPIYFKNVMETILTDILKDTDKSKIDEKIINFKQNMNNTKFTEVGKNSSVKELSKYMSSDNTIGKYKKGTPAHIKAALAYNHLLKYYNCAFKYEPFKDGDKVKWVYMTNNPLGVEAVAFNGYNDPKEITDFISKYVDYTKLWEGEMQNKIDDFYSAMGWDMANENLQKASQFFGF